MNTLGGGPPPSVFTGELPIHSKAGGFVVYRWRVYKEIWKRLPNLRIGRRIEFEWFEFKSVVLESISKSLYTLANVYTTRPPALL